MMFTVGIHTIDLTATETGWHLQCEYEGNLYVCEKANFSPLPSHPSRSRPIKALVYEYDCECSVLENCIVLLWYVDVLTTTITVELKKQTTDLETQVTQLRKEVNDLTTQVNRLLALQTETGSRTSDPALRSGKCMRR